MIRSRGGELAIGSLSQDSNQSMYRVRVEEPPQKPLQPVRNTNPFEYARQMGVLKEQLTRFEILFQAWEDISATSISEFEEYVEPILTQPRTAQLSDVWGAVRRAELFLTEEDLSWSQTPHEYLILVTDGEDNVGVTPMTLTSGATVLLVNGSGALGCLASLKPHRFEAAAAAVRWIIAREEK
ncbi:hypothetical protein ACFL41_00200 [Gemmatimonadota bacterium]